MLYTTLHLDGFRIDTEEDAQFRRIYARLYVGGRPDAAFPPLLLEEKPRAPDEDPVFDAEVEFARCCARLLSLGIPATAMGAILHRLQEVFPLLTEPHKLLALRSPRYGEAVWRCPEGDYLRVVDDCFTDRLGGVELSEVLARDWGAAQ